MAQTLKNSPTNTTLTPEILWEIGRVSLETVSPDGRFAVYRVGKADVPNNKTFGELYVLNLENRSASLFSKDGYSPRWRPDGQRIGFLIDGKLHEAKPDGSEVTAVSDIEMEDFKYAPNGNKILFYQRVDYTKSIIQPHNDLTESTGRVYDGLFYRHWTSWNDGFVNNLFLVDYASGKTVGAATNIQNEPFACPMPPGGGIEQANFSPDGRFVAYSCRKLTPTQAAQSTNSDIYVYEVGSGKTMNITPDLPGYDLDPFFSEDGQYLAWTSLERAGNESDRSRIMMFDTRTNARRELTLGWDFEANHPAFSKDGQSMFFTSARDFTYQIFRIPLSGGMPEQLTEGLHNIMGFVEITEGKILAEHQSMSEPTELYLVDVKTKNAQQVTFVTNNPWNNLKKGNVGRQMVRTKDGHDMNVWVIYPPDFDPTKKYPSLLYCQGGPQSSLSQFFSYRWNFQLMAANGYVVIAPCRRGMPGSGAAWNDAISGDWGGGAIQDYLDAADAFKKMPFIDGNRMGAVGASYGGFAVYFLAGNHQGRFKSFISHCGLFNLESFFGTTEELWFAKHDLNGAYWEAKNPEEWLKFSPHRYVKNWDTPILVIHDEKDFRVPLSEGMQAFQAAQLLGVPSRFLYFKDEGHHVVKPQNSLFWNREFFRWLKETL